MDSSSSVLSPRDDPWAILGVTPGCDAETLRRAYLERLKESPPDRAPAEFERVRDAYEALRDPRRRIETLLALADPDLPLVELLGDEVEARAFVEARLWQEALENP
jgi:DnaJ-domain-containing protein 1